MIRLWGTNLRPEDVSKFLCEQRGALLGYRGAQNGYGHARIPRRGVMFATWAFRREAQSTAAYVENRARSRCSDFMDYDTALITRNSLDLGSGTSCLSLHSCHDLLPQAAFAHDLAKWMNFCHGQVSSDGGLALGCSLSLPNPSCHAFAVSSPWLFSWSLSLSGTASCDLSQPLSFQGFLFQEIFDSPNATYLDNA